ncbi:hypothetical protein V8F20_000397 [Naviculisporaceae sp. PSN 640]
MMSEPGKILDEAWKEVNDVIRVNHEPEGCLREPTIALYYPLMARKQAVAIAPTFAQQDFPRRTWGTEDGTWLRHHASVARSASKRYGTYLGDGDYFVATQPGDIVQGESEDEHEAAEAQETRRPRAKVAVANRKRHGKGMRKINPEKYKVKTAARCINVRLRRLLSFASIDFHYAVIMEAEDPISTAMALPDTENIFPCGRRTHGLTRRYHLRRQVHLTPLQ